MACTWKGPGRLASNRFTLESRSLKQDQVLPSDDLEIVDLVSKSSRSRVMRQVTRVSRVIAVIGLGGAWSCGSSSPSPTGPSGSATALYLIPDRVLIGPGDRERMAALASFSIGESQDVSA